MLDYYIKIFGESIIPRSQLVIIEKDAILDLIRPIHPFAAFLNPIYMFSTSLIIPFIIISSLLMGTEFINKTIKVKNYIHAPLKIFMYKILAVSTINIMFNLYAITLNEILSLLLWPKVKNEYSFFLNMFNLEYNTPFSANIMELTIFIVLLCGITSFYSSISMFITYYSNMASYGMMACILPFVRFNSNISNIIIAPMDAYYYLLSSFILQKKQGNYIIPNVRITSSSFVNTTCVGMILFLICLIGFVKKARKNII